MAERVSMKSRYQYTPSLIGRQVEAEYLSQDVLVYMDNPFIEALPPILDELEVASKILRYPNYNEEQRKLGRPTRLHLVQQISDYVEPLPSHLLVEQRLSRLIRHGYKARNPLVSEAIRQYHIGFKEILETGVNDKGINLAGIRSTAAGFAILGVSGQGKTTAIESSLLLYPQVIHHVSYEGKPFIRKQLVWLKLNCPFDGSLKGLCLNFLQAVDSHLETNYFQKFASKASVDILVPIMAHLATLHGIGILVIDEIQNLSFMKSGGAEKMLNYFTHLINTIGVPVVLIGTFKAMKLLSGSFSQARRSTGQGDLIMDRLTNGDEWNYFIESLWKYQWTVKSTKLSDSIKNTMYDLSQGIVDIAVKLYMLVQWEAMQLEDGKERITVTMLKSVAERHMQLVQPLLKVLKHGDSSARTLVDDLYPNWGVLDEYLLQSIEKVNLQGQIKSKILRNEKVETDKEKQFELIRTAIDFGASPDDAEKIAGGILQLNESEKDMVELRKQVIQEISRYLAVEDIVNPHSDIQRSEKPKRKVIRDEDDLRSAIERKHMSSDEIHEKLVAKGDVPSKDELSKLIV